MQVPSLATMRSMEVHIEPSWKKALVEEFTKPYFKELSEFVRTEYMNSKVFPPPKDVFRAFDLCPFDTVKVVVLGQDPYHGAGQANGLSFAVSEGLRTPPSLQNIFKELESDLGHSVDRNPDLSRWARQGVLLLNATLTVREGNPGSHQGKGWEQFTDAVVKVLNEQKEHLVFLLWGAYAQKKGIHIDRTKHLVLSSPHPSPFSAHTGFLGNKHFSSTNAFLIEKRCAPIEW